MEMLTTHMLGMCHETGKPSWLCDTCRAAPFVARCNAAIVIQRHVRGFLLRERLAMCPVCFCAIEDGGEDHAECGHKLCGQCAGRWFAVRAHPRRP